MTRAIKAPPKGDACPHCCVETTLFKCIKTNITLFVPPFFENLENYQFQAGSKPSGCPFYLGAFLR
jgi:hypothetical protein